MRRLIGSLLIAAMVLLPVATSCVPTGYAGKNPRNPARPAGNQLTPDQVQNRGETAPTDATTGSSGSQSENGVRGGQ